MRRAILVSLAVSVLPLVAHAEGFLSFGAGADVVALGGSTSPVPVIYGGVGLRIFITPGFSARFDTRDAVMATAARGLSGKQVLQLTLALAVNLSSND